MTLPASFRGKNTTRPDYEHQNSNLYAISGQSDSHHFQSIKYHIVSLMVCEVSIKMIKLTPCVISLFKFECRFLNLPHVLLVLHLFLSFFCELKMLFYLMYPLL